MVFMIAETPQADEGSGVMGEPFSADDVPMGDVARIGSPGRG
jgi:hypothetical protein